MLYCSEPEDPDQKQVEVLHCAVLELYPTLVPPSLFVLNILWEESVSQIVHGLLSQLGKVKDPCNHQSNEHQWQHHTPHCGEDVVAFGFGTIAMSSFQIPSHLLIPSLQGKKKVIFENLLLNTYSLYKPLCCCV